MDNAKIFARWIDIAAFVLIFGGVIGGIAIRSHLPSVPIPDLTRGDIFSKPREEIGSIQRWLLRF
jgi:hypothetical protein